MTRVLAPLAVVAWAGATLLLSTTRWAQRPRLPYRVDPYAPAAPAGARPGAASTLRSVHQALAPLARDVGDALARITGVTEDAERRLERIQSPLTVTGLRTRQAVWAVIAFAATAALVGLLGVPAVPAAVLLLAAPLLAFLGIEQQLASRSAARQQRLTLELPVVAEQLGMLLSAGYSLGGALTRLASRGNGVAADDLGRVCGRIRQGLSEHDALQEWAALADVVGVHRLVAVLALHREAGDLGRLISEEARGMRQDAHRQLLETIERRSQLVWVPVTVATLVPGVIFLAVPFVDALALFTAG